MIKPILLKRMPFSAARMELVIDNFLEEAAKNIKVDFDVTTQTWKKRPGFVIEKNTRFSRKIMTSNKIYYFVSGGTSKRFAVMTPGFRAKTVVRQIRSRKGKGGFFVFSSRPLKGIDARDFPITIVNKQVKFFQRMWNTAVEAELRYGRAR